MEVWTMSRISCRKESEACSPMKSRSPRALLSMRGLVRTETSGLPLSPLIGIEVDVPFGLGTSRLAGASGSKTDLEAMEFIRVFLGEVTMESSRSHSPATPPLTQFVHGLLPLHFFFRCLHRRHAFATLIRSLGATFFRGIRKINDVSNPKLVSAE